jgi:hypothetical protein
MKGKENSRVSSPHTAVAILNRTSHKNIDYCFLVESLDGISMDIIFCNLVCHIFLAEVQNVLIMKSNEMHDFSDLFDKVLYIFRICPLSIIRSISTLHTRNRYLSC